MCLKVAQFKEKYEILQTVIQLACYHMMSWQKLKQ